MRISREDGDKDESDSITNQRKLLRNYIKDKENFVLYDEYLDDGYSGTNFERPDFKRMLNDIEEGRINCVIVKDLSRFGRDYIDTGFFLERYFADKEIRFIAVNDNFDSSKDDGGLLIPFKNIFNAQYAKDISTKVQTAFKAKQRAGEFIGAFPSYGYKKSPHDHHKLIIDEYAASVVRRIFQLYIEGNGKIAIAKILNQEGILCPSAYKKAEGFHYSNCKKLVSTSYWTYSTINYILKNEMYIGNMVQGKTKRRMKGKANPVHAKDWIIVENTHDSIIDVDIWNKVQSLIKKEVKQFDMERNVSIFAGFLKCGDCGRALGKKLPYVKPGINRDSNCMKGVSYVCSTYTKYGKTNCTPHRISHDLLEQILLEDFNKMISSFTNLQQIADKIQNQVSEKIYGSEAEKRKIDLELSKVKKLKKEVYEDYKEELLTKEEYLSYRKDYEEKEEHLVKKKEYLAGKAEKTKNKNINSPWVNELIRNNKITELDRELIIDMIDKIFVYEGNRIKIIYNFSLEI
ncbi:resolvase [Anaerosacchariphilus polymeriproducens]|uniref:Resolvase n=2 Tax=Anaerosacchariphilus polymeriproducens TaxID=1812858 RepID=A0A371ARV6_9FIRM|nr:resolvase [Anaerosacchariphilus polymeriproducens]